MDYKGQELAEWLFNLIIIFCGGVGWIYGYLQQDFSYVFQAWLVGLIIACILCVPDWPFYNRHPVKWLKEIPDRRSSVGTKIRSD